MGEQRVLAVMSRWQQGLQGILQLGKTIPVPMAQEYATEAEMIAAADMLIAMLPSRIAIDMFGWQADAYGGSYCPKRIDVMRFKNPLWKGESDAIDYGSLLEPARDDEALVRQYLPIVQRLWARLPEATGLQVGLFGSACEFVTLYVGLDESLTGAV